jgi:hypothetical protein
MHMLHDGTPCVVIRRRGERVLVRRQLPAESRPIELWVDISEVQTMNQDHESEKALVSAIEELGIYGTRGVPRLLRALTWWADARGLRGHVVSQLLNDLHDQQTNADTLQGLLDALEAANVESAVNEVASLRKELEETSVALDEQGKDYDATVEGLEKQVIVLTADRDRALLEASERP